MKKTITDKPTPEPLSVGVNDAADMIGISRANVYNEIKIGRLKTFRFGSRRLIPMTALKEWLDAMVERGGISTEERIEERK
jgi:excisionase family DNA binding protein